jgi:hypothetical protein
MPPAGHRKPHHLRKTPTKEEKEAARLEKKRKKDEVAAQRAEANVVAHTRRASQLLLESADAVDTLPQGQASNQQPAQSPQRTNATQEDLSGGQGDTHTPAPANAPPTNPPAATAPDRGRSNFLDDSFAPISVSITIAKRGEHIPPLWINRTIVFASMFFERYAIAIEAGGRMRHQHLQGIADIRIKGDDQSFKALIKMLKQFVPMAVGSKATIQMKALMAGQTFDLMLGYVQKDCGEPYYNIFVKAVSAQELADGRANYSAVKVSILPYHMLTAFTTK